MIKIEIQNPTVENVAGTSSRTGKPFSFNKQEAYAHIPGQHYPQRIELTLEDNSTGYPAGNYTIQPESLYVDRFGRLQLGQLKLKPIKGAQAA